MPAYVGLPNTHSVGLCPGYHGGAYLGVAYNPFAANGDPNSEALPRAQPDPARRPRRDRGSRADRRCSPPSTAPAATSTSRA